MRIFIKTADKFRWSLRITIHYLEKYWPEHPPVFLCGYEAPDFPLPADYIWHSLGSNADYPAARWSDATLKGLDAFGDDLLIWLMDDFWLLRPVDDAGVRLLFNLMRENTMLARVDLSTDRLYAAGVIDVGKLGHLDLIANRLPVAYHLSFQAGIWRREALRQYLVPGENPQQTEINGTSRMLAAGANVWGTRQAPLRYLIAVQGGKLALDGGYQKPHAYLPEAEISELRALGYLVN